MSVVLDLPPEVEAGLAAQARARGLALRDYLTEMVQKGAQVHTIEALSPEQRAALWREAARNLPQNPPLSNEAISRASIYRPRG